MGVTVQAVFRPTSRRRVGSLLWLPLAFLALLVAAVGTVVSYVLWPTWSDKPIPLNAPALPITVAGVLFDIPPAAVRFAVQRHSGPQERVDLVFLWPSLTPPHQFDDVANKPAGQTFLARGSADRVPLPSTDNRLFVTVAALGVALTPDDRLRVIYPRYVEKRATAGPDGLAILAFRPGTPYEGEDLVYLAQKPEKFFARCTRDAGALPGICMYDLALGAAKVTLRFPRDWLGDWRKVAARVDRLVAKLHPADR